MPARMRGHCRAPNRSAPRSTGTPPRSAAPATLRSGAASPRTRAAVAVRGPEPERQTDARRSALEPRRDRSPRWLRHGCAGMSAKSAMDDDISIDAIPIANDISWRLLPAVSLGQLARNPMGARARGHAQPHKLAAVTPVLREIL